MAASFSSILYNPKFPIIVTAYTQYCHLGDYYKRMIAKLVHSCVKFDLSFVVYPLKGTEDWIAGCSLKPTVILHALETLQQPILWIDADAEIFQYPEKILELKSDMALCKAGKSHWLTGTLYIRPKLIDTVKKWIDETPPNVADEVSLLHLCRRSNINHTILPTEYNTVVHSETDVSKVVIGHYIRPDVAPIRGVEAVQHR